MLSRLICDYPLKTVNNYDNTSKVRRDIRTKLQTKILFVNRNYKQKYYLFNKLKKEGWTINFNKFFPIVGCAINTTYCRRKRVNKRFVVLSTNCHVVSIFIFG